MVLDNDFRIIRTNQSAVRFFNLPIDQILGEHCYNLVHDCNEPFKDCPLIEMKATGQHAEREFFFSEYNKWVHAVVDPIVDANGKTVGAIHTIKDISERKHAEEVIRKSEEKYRDIFERAIEGIFQSTPEGKFISVNPAMARIAGYESPQDMIDNVTHIGELLYANREDRLIYMAVMKEKGFVTNYEIRHKRKDGSYFWASLNARAEKDENGNVLYYEGTLEDITERKIADERLHILLAELEEKNRELEKAYEELKESEAWLVQSEKMSSLGQLSAGIAHELKNPLGIILQGINYIQLSVEDEIMKEACERIKKSAVRADSIIQNLLNFARQTPPSLSETDIRSLIEEVLAMVEHQMGLKNIQVIRNFPSDVPKIKVDNNQIKQVFINIFINATDAMKHGGTVTITIMQILNKEGEPCLEIRVKDTGMGIPENVLDKVFDPFFSTKRDTGGTGLGLSVTKGIIDRHKGNIAIESKYNEGTTVTIMFPCD